jgi:hypothetical protein
VADQCDPQIYEKGTPICIIAGPKAADIESWVQQIAQTTEQKVDWHFVGGRAVVKYLGDSKGAFKVVDAIKSTLPLLEAIYALTTEATQFPEFKIFMWCADIRAIAEPREQAAIEEAREQRYQRNKLLTDQKLLDTVYLVEADANAMHQLWCEWCWNRDAEWEEDLTGTLPQIGTLADMPVTLHLSWAIIAGQRVGFWYMPSMVTDHRLAQKWIKENLPNVREKSDATNFGNIVRSIRGHVKRDFVRVKLSHSSERCPTCQRR